MASRAGVGLAREKCASVTTMTGFVFSVRRAVCPNTAECPNIAECPNVFLEVQHPNAVRLDGAAVRDDDDDDG